MGEKKKSLVSSFEVFTRDASEVRHEGARNNLADEDGCTDDKGECSAEWTMRFLRFFDMSVCNNA